MNVHPTNRRPVAVRPAAPPIAPAAAALAAAAAFAAAAALAACSADVPTTATSHTVIGACARDEAVLRGPALDCAIDANCPCGAYCDLVGHQCRFDCTVPPAGPGEACATGTACDDTGRCVGPASSPPALAPALDALPPSVTTTPGGAARTVQARLTAFSSTAAAAAQATAVRAVGTSGAEVSCDAATFGPSCVLTGWAFGFDGARYTATRPLRVRTVPGTADGDGEVHLVIDAIATEVVVPAPASAAVVGDDGEYVGTVARAGVPARLAISAKLRGSYLVVRDPTRTIAPDGTIAVRVITPTTPAPPAARVVWLRPPGAATGGAITAEYLPVALTASPSGGIGGALAIRVLGGTTTWSLDLARSEARAECASAASCASAEVCPSELHTCISQDAWNGAPAIDNQFDDPRGAQWWSAVAPGLGVGDTPPAVGNPAFATTGADLIENLLCATPTAPGRLGVTQIRTGTLPSHSGDLACVADAGGQNLSPGAVGLTTRYDRAGSAVSSALLATCLTDLARPVTGSLATNLAITTGDCVNLARALPALRLLGTGELGKRTAITTPPVSEPRLAGLFRRLVQGWAHLHGFVASTGLAQREYDDAIAATPAAARQNLLALLDALDAGWSALLDQRIAPVVANAAASAAGTDAALFTPQLDYRLVKRPVAYWTFNAGSLADLISGLPLASMAPCFAFNCTPPPSTCLMQATESSLRQTYSCPGYRTAVPADGPSLGTGGNLSVVFNLDPQDHEFPSYRGGTIVATSQLAVIETWDLDYPVLNLIHPTSATTTETVTFTVGGLGHWTGPPTGGPGPARGSSVAVVRDAVNKTYTVYVYSGDAGTSLQAFTRPYTTAVAGRLASIGAQQILVGAGPSERINNWWTTGTPQLRASYAGRIDDVAVFDSMLSRREVARFASARGYLENRRDVWPADPALTSYPTQDLASPLATDLLDAQIAHLALADRLAIHMRSAAEAACDSGDPTAIADVTAITARLGRTLRQTAAVEGLVARAAGDTTQRDRAQLGAGMSQLLRDLDTLVACRPPYALAPTDVPLYFDSISPTTSETQAFFAASDHLLGLAEQRAQTAQAALDTVRTRWDQARQSQLQQLQDDTSRAIRVDELTTRYGEAMIRLCGIADRTAAQVVADISAGTFAFDTCFLKPPGPPPAVTCPTSSTSGPVMDADPSCYRGALGGALMDIRSAYHAQQAAYQAWQAGVGNAQAANKLCVLKEIDVFGCTALDRHTLSGVSCPPGHQGTLQLTADYLSEMSALEQASRGLGAMLQAVSSLGTIVAAAATGPGAAFFGAALGAMSLLQPELHDSMAARQRAHEAMLQERAMIDDVRTCWNQADQYERAIAAAEEASKAATSQLTAAIIAFDNGVAEGREILLEAPIAIDRERTRPALPIAFHYWLPEAGESYQLAFESARRYTYLALRATEYDALRSFAVAAAGQPSRGAVLGAWLPPTLTQQLARMRDQTNTRTTAAGPPRLAHLAFDLGAKFFGLAESAPEFGATLVQYARPVYSQRGEYLGLGVRFSLVPDSDAEVPTWRCAERIWRVNVGASGISAVSGVAHVKLLKRNVFASRACRADGFQAATLRPASNLLVAAGDTPAYTPELTSSVADVGVVDFDQPDALFGFKTRDDYLNGSSAELALQGLYGDYLLLFPAPLFDAGLALDQLRDFFLRFDFLSVDDTPPTSTLRVQLAPGAIVVP